TLPSTTSPRSCSTPLTPSAPISTPATAANSTCKPPSKTTTPTCSPPPPPCASPSTSTTSSPTTHPHTPISPPDLFRHRIGHRNTTQSQRRPSSPVFRRGVPLTVPVNPRYLEHFRHG